jgi:hypothetical protein
MVFGHGISSVGSKVNEYTSVYHGGGGGTMPISNPNTVYSHSSAKRCIDRPIICSHPGSILTGSLNSTGNSNAIDGRRQVRLVSYKTAIEGGQGAAGIT